MRSLHRLIYATSFAALALTAGVSCTSRTSESAKDSSIRLNKALFGFDYQKSKSLTLAKADPATGDHWMVHVERKQDQPTAFFENDPWVIRTYSENSGIQDRLANRNLILHLLDTLSTLQATAVVKEKRDDSVSELGSYGLNPPRYAVTWEAWDGATGKMKTFEVAIGSLVEPGAGSTESYALLPPSRGVYKVNGAAMAMLGYIRDFSTIRQEALSPISADDADEIEVFRGSTKTLYAQREGDRWTNAAHHPVKGDVSGLLARLTHLRIARFVDSEREAAPIRNALKRPTTRIVLRDRESHTTEFRIGRTAGSVYATVTPRSDAVFELFPESLRHLSY